MQSVAEFKKKVSGSFLNHLYKNSYLRWSGFPLDRNRRDRYLESLYKIIGSGLYTPSFPREYIVSNKHNSVARIVPSLTLNDYCVYYFCTKSVENYLAVNRVEGTYGGFSLGGEFRKREDKEFRELQEVAFSISPFTYNPLAWVKAWRDFQKKAKVYSADTKYTYFLKYDIANFYNTINLSLLEPKVRMACPKEFTDEIDLLFFFLKYWNKRFLKYAEQTISIPQDEVGDCSRLLANFYLQDYDRTIFNRSKKMSCVYMRYADDQIIMTSNEKTAEDLLFYASKELFKLGLNINSAKVIRFTRSEWEYYWCFDTFDQLGDPKNVSKIEKAVDDISKLDKNKCRYDSLLKRILNCEIERISVDKKVKFLSLVSTDDFLLNCDSRLIVRIYKLLGKNEKRSYLNKLNNLSKVARFNSYHYNLLRAKNAGLPINFANDIYKKIEELKL